VFRCQATWKNVAVANWALNMSSDLFPEEMLTSRIHACTDEARICRYDVALTSPSRPPWPRELGAIDCCRNLLRGNGYHC
jgi:hypothetical protein